MRATRLYVSIPKIKANMAKIEKKLGNNTQMMPIIKCNAYGTHFDKLTDLINQFDYVGVALVDEGIALREAGYKNNILVLYPPMKEELKAIEKHNLFFNGCDIEVLEYFNQNTKKPLAVHIEFETGMGRTGVQVSNINSYIKRLKKLKNIQVDGVYSHLSSSSFNAEFTQLQVERFKRVLEILIEKAVSYKWAHICNSAAVFNFRASEFNMARIGLLVYGYYPNEQLKKDISLEPCMTLKTRVSFIKKISVGDTVGYNQNFIAEKERMIATIPFGFGDGLIGLEAGAPEHPYVIIKNSKAKIIAICTDNMMIDVTDIPNVKTGDEVIIFDNEQLTVEELAKWCNGICNYEIISSLSARIPRVFN